MAPKVKPSVSEVPIFEDGPGATPGSAPAGFTVNLENFEGPFDLLLGLISKRELDITEVALAQVTDEFIAYMRIEPDLSRTSEFLVVAATLLDMKARSLLPHDDEQLEEDLEYLEARDLLFSRLLQYRAFKQVATVFGGLWEANASAHPRDAALEPRFSSLLPKLRWSITPPELAKLAADALYRTPPTVVTTHLHDPLVPVREQAEYILKTLRTTRRATFEQLCEGAPDVNTVVSRFLAVLDLYREGALRFNQEKPLGTLEIEWTGQDTDVTKMAIEDEDDAIAQI
ncbi:MAG: ScpA family protein [Actinomycetaceae bacterium]|nr:ScpA family protein [Actinomycetaceae bacterium]